MNRLIADRAFGKKSERELFDKLNELWGHDIKKEEDDFAIYDYYSDYYYYELKTRKNTYDAYPTTVIAKDKIIENCDRGQLFLFRFLTDTSDELYYKIYTKNKFDKYKCEPFRRYDRGDIDKLKLYYFIPIGDLKKVNFE